MATPIDWRRQEGARQNDLHGCDIGPDAMRGWSDGGDPHANPDAFEKVCVYRTPFVAWVAYRLQSLHRVAGEDWPNFEPDSEAPTAPRRAPLDALRADEWELRCGLGDPDKRCQVWTSRARYDEVHVVMELRAIDGGVGFDAVRRFVESVDGDLAAKMRAG